MASTNAERQARDRERNRAAGVDPEVADRPRTERLSTVIDVTAKRNLERLAAWHDVSQRQVLEKLINQGEAALVDSLDTAARQEYWQVGDRAADQREARAMRRMTGRRGNR
ncbi:MAG: hypothetical protein ACOYD0_00580 [Candidatus Nanopelagicales bacterium]